MQGSHGLSVEVKGWDASVLGPGLSLRHGSFHHARQVGAALVDHLREARLEVVVLILEGALLHGYGLDQLHRVLQLHREVVRVVSLVGTGALRLDPLVVDLLVGEGQFFLHALNLLNKLALVKRLLSHDLSTQVLNLRSEALLDCSVLLAHDLTPDAVQLVQDLTDASLGHLAAEVVLDLQNCAHGLRWDPVVVLRVLGLLRAALN